MTPQSSRGAETQPEWHGSSGTSRRSPRSDSRFDAVDDLIKVLAAQPEQRMLLLGSGGFLAGTLGLAAGQIDRARGALGRSDQLVDAKGLYTNDLPPSAGEAGVRSLKIYSAKYPTREKDASNDVMENLSASTGGKFVRNSNDLAGGYAEELTEVPEGQLSAGVSRPPESDGKFHSLKVQVPGRKGYEIQARKGYMSEKKSAPKEERKIDREVFTTSQAHDAPGRAEFDDTNLRLPVEAP